MDDLFALFLGILIGSLSCYVILGKKTKKNSPKIGKFNLSVATRSNRNHMTRIMKPDDANPAGTVHGGETLRSMDQCAWLAASRYISAGTKSGQDYGVLTARMESMNFKKPMYLHEIAHFDGTIIGTSEHSVEVLVRVSAENVTTGEMRETNDARFWIVAPIKQRLPGNKKFLKVPEFTFENDEVADAFKERYQKQKSGRLALLEALPDDNALEKYINEFYNTYNQRVEGSESILSQVVLPGACAKSGIVFSGHLMKMMDNGSGVTAIRHTKNIAGRQTVVTASVESIDFIASAKHGDIITCYSKVIFTSSRSMIILSMILSERSQNGKSVKVLITLATYTFVALGEARKVLAVPQIEQKTDLDTVLYNFGKGLYEQKRKERQEAKARAEAPKKDSD